MKKLKLFENLVTCQVNECDKEIFKGCTLIIDPNGNNVAMITTSDGKTVRVTNTDHRQLYELCQILSNIAVGGKMISYDDLVDAIKFKSNGDNQMEVINENSDPSLNWVVVNGQEKFEPDMNGQGQIFCSIVNGRSVITWNGKSFYKNNSSRKEIEEILDEIFAKTYSTKLTEDLFQKIMLEHGYNEKSINESRISPIKLYNLAKNSSKIAADLEAILTKYYGNEYKEKYGSDDFATIMNKLDEAGQCYEEWFKHQLLRLTREHSEDVAEFDTVKLVGESVYDDVVSKLSFGEKEYKEKIKGHESEFVPFKQFVKDAIETQKDEFGEDDLVNQSVDLIESVYAGLPSDSGL